MISIFFLFLISILFDFIVMHTAHVPIDYIWGCAGWRITYYEFPAGNVFGRIDSHCSKRCPDALRSFFSFLRLSIHRQSPLLEKRHLVCTQQGYMTLVRILPLWVPERLPASCFPISTLDASSALGHCSDGSACSLVVFNGNLKNRSCFKHTDILMELKGC